jgi:hypothetical protein
MQKAQASLERLGVVAALTGVNPVELLGDLIDQSAAIVAYLREQVAALPAVLTADGTHPLVRLYGQERDRAARVAREAVALGLEERRVRIDELTRDRLARLFLAAVADPERGPAARQRPGPWRSGQAPPWSFARCSGGASFSAMMNPWYCSKAVVCRSGGPTFARPASR